MTETLTLSPNQQGHLHCPPVPQYNGVQCKCNHYIGSYCKIYIGSQHKFSLYIGEQRKFHHNEGQYTFSKYIGSQCKCPHYIGDGWKCICYTCVLCKFPHDIGSQCGFPCYIGSQYKFIIHIGGHTAIPIYIGIAFSINSPFMMVDNANDLVLLVVGVKPFFYGLNNSAPSNQSI